jgi:hypothetical protein
MDTPTTENTMLEILRNIELNTAQQSPTSQNADSIAPLSMRVLGQSPLGVNPTNTQINDGLMPQTFLFPIPLETPYLIVPEIMRSIALYRDNEQKPFAFVNAGQTRSFKLPHLQQLRVDVLPGAEYGTITLYASSRPYETPPSLQPSGYRVGLNQVLMNAAESYYSPIHTCVDMLSIGWHFRELTFDAGITSVDVHIQAIDATIMATIPGESPLVTIAGPTNTTPPFALARTILTQPSRNFVFRVTPNGAGTIVGYIEFEFIK